MAVAASHVPLGLGPAGRARLERHIERARRRGAGTIASVTVEVDPDVDPCAVLYAAREPGEPWALIDQPERGFALATLGSVARIAAESSLRFTLASHRWRDVAASAVADAPDGPAGSGLVLVGGFAFADEGGRASHWRSFGAAGLDVPQIALARSGDRARLTVAVAVDGPDRAAALVAAVEARLADLRVDAVLPLWDPDPAGAVTVSGAMAPEHYEHAVERALELIADQEIEKIVLAREVHVEAQAAHEPGAVFGILREVFPSCHCFAVGRGDAALVAASPELLVRREGMRAATIALAGSTGRSADPAVDAHLGEQLLRSAKNRAEQDIVVRRIRGALEPHSVWVTNPDEPELAQIANIQHLATPVRAQLREATSTIELAGALHPTPAVGGEPKHDAGLLIPRLEGLDRGWYAGAVGWTDLAEDGEFFVALRCALLRGRLARCYAGVGVVAGSDPVAELAETEVKLQAVLPALGA